jgi:hypothetical protein
VKRFEVGRLMLEAVKPAREEAMRREYYMNAISCDIDVKGAREETVLKDGYAEAMGGGKARPYKSGYS